MNPGASPDPDARDPYAVLEISPSASLEEIKQAYFAQVRAHPPEREPAAFKRIRAAYDQLKTAEKKLDTDMTRFQEWPEPILPPLPPLQLKLERADVLCVARALSDLARHDWRDDWREVRL